VLSKLISFELHLFFDFIYPNLRNSSEAEPWDKLGFVYFNYNMHIPIICSNSSLSSVVQIDFLCSLFNAVIICNKLFAYADSFCAEHFGTDVLKPNSV
jgi:hypothetical protein